MWLEGVCPKKKPCTRANRWDRSNAAAGLDVGRPWREWQPHVEDLAPSEKCKVRQVSIALWWEISNDFWGFSSPRLLCSPLSLSLSSILYLALGSAELSVHSLPLPVCVLWTPHTVLLKGRVIKRPFMQAWSLWWGCHFVQCSALSLRNFRQAWPHPHRRTDRWTDGQTDPTDDCQYLGLKPGNWDSAWLQTLTL